MSESERTRIESVFEAALERTPEQRDDFIERACGGDPACAHAVRALLAAHDRTGGVLEGDALAALQLSTAPERAGPYRIGRVLGRGGMGAVFLGERSDGQFQRRVAIKLIDSPADPALHARIVAERRFLAALEHPNIARLLDGGITDDGRPFLVMEHVEGLPIDAFCDRMRLNLRARLQLFLQVLRAVEHAHRNLIVHRDLKPSNILVTAGGVVKLLDFGIAKLLNPTLAHDGHTDTALERPAFTPDYASPEQLRGEPVSTASDVYSLGVVLYRLLTGVPPFDTAGRSLSELVLEAGTRDPLRPAARLRVLAEQEPARCEAIARARDTTPTRLARALAGDIDAIVLMALRTEPQHRYGSAELLAQDIERYLHAKPVYARHGNTGYRIRKLVRRHRTQVTAALIVVAALVSGASIAIWQAGAARQARDRAERARLEAEEVSTFLVGLFEGGVPDVIPSAGLTAQDLIARGVARVEGLSAAPAVQARLLATLARVQESLGRYEEGQRLAERALTVHLSAHGEDVEAGRLLTQLGVLLRRRALYDSALVVFERARRLQEPHLATAGPDFGYTLSQLASLAIYRGDLIESERRSHEAYELFREQAGDSSEQTLNALVNLATTQRRRGLQQDAQQNLERALALRRQYGTGTRYDLAANLLHLADQVRFQPGGIDRAERLAREALALERADQPEDQGFGGWARESLAATLELRGDVPAAEALLEEVVELRRATYGSEHPSPAFALGNLASFYARNGRADTAQVMFAEVLALQARIVGENHPDYGGTLSGLAAALHAAGRLREADSVFGRSIEVRAGRQGRSNLLIASLLFERVRLQLAMGDTVRAVTMLREVREIASRQAAPGAAFPRAVDSVWHALRARRPEL